MHILGIDIGGSGIKGGIVDTTTGEMVSEKFRLATPRPAIPMEVAKTVHQIVDHFNWKGEVGAGFPTPLFHGKCLSGGNLHPDWKGVQADELFKSVTGLEFTVINDADAAAEAEAEAAETPMLREFNNARRYAGKGVTRSTSRAPRRKSQEGFGTAVAQVVIKELKGTTGRRIVRGILGGLFKGR